MTDHFSNRKSGILLHPTSLPGAYGIGEIGLAAKTFLHQLSRMKQGIWQVLPMGPTGYGDSPYQSFSSFAGNDLLICFDTLKEEGLLLDSDLEGFPHFDPERISFGDVIPQRMEVLAKVCERFDLQGPLAESFEAFCQREAYWLDNYALFRAIKTSRGERPWTEWPEPLRTRNDQALAEAREALAPQILHIKIRQFLFDRQWSELRALAKERGILIVGDIPIFVAHDSADVWSDPELFFLKDDGHPTVVAGVPPDYFSETGQLWGNPLYDWPKHKETNYAWWSRRVQRCMDWYDIVRIDHFRGFEAYYEIPGDAETAVNGRWVKGPDKDLFYGLRENLGDLPIIAEDLGVITDEVDELRDTFEFPGMRIMQFSFGPPDEDQKEPLDFPERCVAYTGTHDNDTFAGWYHRVAGENNSDSAEGIAGEHARIEPYFKGKTRSLHYNAIQILLETKAQTAVFPLQDLMGIGSEGRMNRPGIPAGNWQWRYLEAMLTDECMDTCAEITKQTHRLS